MATNLLEKYGKTRNEFPHLGNSSVDLLGEGKTFPEAFSFPRVAIDKIRQLRTELEHENLSLMLINNDDLIIVIEALYAARVQNISSDVPLDDIYGKVIRFIHKSEEARNWILAQVGDTAFTTRVCRNKAEGVLQECNAVTQIGAYHILEGVLEIRNKAIGGSIWYVTIERSGADMNRAVLKFIIYAQKDKNLIDHFVEFSHSLLHKAHQDGRANRTIYCLNSNLAITMSGNQSWNDIFMTQEVRRNLHDDFHFFLKNENWFRTNRLPFKRGYLLTGLPGNGKTTAIRAMASTPGFRAFSFDFQSPNNGNNEDLFRAFERALQGMPSIFILEDVDRIFEEGQTHTKVTKDAILNCLDGLGDRDGVIVVATANNPELLDEALLKRPGRFDRIVKFEPPDAAMRHKMLTRLFGANSSNEINEDTLTWLAAESDGYSMASVKEIFVASASLAFQEGSVRVTAEHAREALSAIRKQYSKTASKSIGLR